MKIKFKKNIKIKFIRIYFLFLFFFILSIYSIYSIYSINKNNQFDGYKKTNITLIKKNIPEIYTNDNFLLATNLETYKLYLNPKHINLELINVYFNIIENILNKKIINKKEIVNNLKRNKRTLIIKNIFKDEIKKIKLQNKLLSKIGFYKKFRNRNGILYNYGAEFFKNKKRNRFYNSNIQNFEPFIGYYNYDNIATNGFEKYLAEKFKYKNIYFYKKDRYGNILYNDKNINSINKLYKQNSIKLSINYKLQLLVNKILDKHFIKNEAENIVVSIIESNTGKIKVLTQLKRYNPFNFNKNSYYSNDYIKYLYEPGSTFKPITLSIALDNNIITDLNQTFELNHGKLRIGKKIITDEHESNIMTVKEIISNSSNVGIAKIALLFNNNEFVKTLLKYNFFKNDDIELPFKKSFIFSNELKHKLKLNKKIYRAVSAFGYSFQTNLLHLTSLYNAIANNGIFVNLSLINDSNKTYNRIFSIKNNNLIEETLKEVVENGTAIATKNNFLNIYGKTGTAQRNVNGKYIHSYNSSFIGFVEGKNKRYTISVLVIKPNWITHFASLSAVPIFKDISNLLLKNNYLTPILNKEKK